MRRLIGVVVAAVTMSLVLVGTASAGHLEPRQLVTPLTGEAEVPAVETDGVGAAIITVIPSGIVCAELIATGIGPATGAHIHKAGPGSNGGVVVSLGAFDGHGTSCQFVDPKLADDLAAHPKKFYVNVHTEAVPSGELRGQLALARPGLGFAQATLTGDQEVPAVETDGVGLANILFDRMTGVLCSSVIVDGIEPAWGSHIHAAPAGSNGGVVVDLGAVDGFSVGCQRVSGDIIKGLFLATDQFYVNVHTDAVPSGELRGQLSTTNNTAAVTIMTGSQEVPPVDSAGVGITFVVLDEARGVLCSIMTVSGIGAAWGSHIHEGAAGTNGDVVVSLGAIDGFEAGCQSVDGDTIGSLTADWSGFYVNVHTDAVPSGELRGQLIGL